MSWNNDLFSLSPSKQRESFAKLLGCGSSVAEIEAAVVTKTGVAGDEKDRIIRGFKWLVSLVLCISFDSEGLSPLDFL